MTPRSPSLFHLHFQVPDVGYAQSVLTNCGLPLHRRYGRVDDRPRSFGPDEAPPSRFQLRLQDAQRGTANVTIAPGPRLRFDHIGVLTASFDDVLSRARDEGWYVDDGDRRTFLHTPWGFRVEVHPFDHRVASTLGSPGTGRFERVELAVANPGAVRSSLDGLLGPLDTLSIEGWQGNEPTVGRVRLAGAEVPANGAFHKTDLVAEVDVN